MDNQRKTTQRPDRDRWRRMQQVLDEVRQQRAAGEDILNAEIERLHPSLMPELKMALELLPVNPADCEIDPRDKRPKGTDPVLLSDPIARLLQQHLDRYRLQAFVGRGSQGVVYMAEDTRTCSTVAIKVMEPAIFASDRSRRRFAREIDLVARLNHANVVSLNEHGTVRGRYYFVMPFIHGTPLDEHVELLGPSLVERLEMMIQVCHAVEHAHHLGIIHRDLKPSNILVDIDCNPMVLDFGLGMDLAETPQPRLRISPTPQEHGTLAFASPEQLSPDPDSASTTSDVYALGVLLFLALTGEFPYNIFGPPQKVRDHILRDSAKRLRHAAREHKGVQTIRPAELTSDLEAVVFRALEKSPERRYQSCHELADDLRRCIENRPVSARRGHRWYHLRKFASRHWMPASAVCLALMGAVLLWSRHSLIRDRELLRAEAATAQREAQASVADRAAVPTSAIVVPEQLADMSEAEKADYFRWMQRPVVPFSEIYPESLPDPPVVGSSRYVQYNTEPLVVQQVQDWLVAIDSRLDELRYSLLDRRVTFELPATDIYLVNNRSLAEAKLLAYTYATRAIIRARMAPEEIDLALEDLAAARNLAYSLEQGTTFARYISALGVRLTINRTLMEMLRLSAPSQGLLDFIRAETNAPSLDPAWSAVRSMRMPFIRRALRPGAGADPVVDLHYLDKLMGGELTRRAGEHAGNLSLELTLHEWQDVLTIHWEQPRPWEQLPFVDLYRRNAQWGTEFIEARNKYPLLLIFEPRTDVLFVRPQAVAGRRALRLSAFICQYRAQHGDWPAELADAVPDIAACDLQDPITGAAFRYAPDEAAPWICSAPILDQKCLDKLGLWWPPHAIDQPPGQITYVRLHDRAE